MADAGALLDLLPLPDIATETCNQRNQRNQGVSTASNLCWLPAAWLTERPGHLVPALLPVAGP